MFAGVYNDLWGWIWVDTREEGLDQHIRYSQIINKTYK